MLIDTRCGRLFVDVRGNDRSPTICLWHSLLADGGMWDATVAALESRYRVVNIDAPGHGRSAPTKHAYTMDDSVEAAIEVLGHLGIERCVWVGLSWGGMVGMRLALRAPSLLAGMVLFDTNAHAESRRKLPSYVVMAAISRRLGTVPILLDRLEPIFFSRATRESRPAIVRAFRERLSAMDPPSIGHATDAVIFGRKDLRPRLGEIRVPTMVVCGRDDVATPVDRSKTIAEGIPGATLELIGGAGHLSAWERPDEANRLITSFLSRISY
jgi:3-oxoadipate enol-lactonase